VKRLTLIRHANADWKNLTVPDFDRPLTKRGITEAESIGKLLLENELVPDLILASTARRAQQTTEVLARKFELAPRLIKSAESLYLATVDDILALVQVTGPKVQHLAIVGHNPGLSELARHLAPFEAEIVDLTTAAACSLTFGTRAWSSVGPPAHDASQFQPPSKLFSLFA
jgi:phosphohistidine phosphatase